MAFASGFVVSVIHNNKPLREVNNCGERVARLAFDSEYKLRLKNKTNGRALASIHIDGTDIMNGSQLIINSGETIDLERFVDELDKGRKFKFMSVEKGSQTGEIQDPTSVDNGLIEVKFFKERRSFLRSIDMGHTLDRRIGGQSCFHNSSEPVYQSNTGDTVLTASACCDSAPQMALNSIGATAEGGHSDQQFIDSSEFIPVESTPEVISIRLKGRSIDIPKTFGVYIKGNSTPEATFDNRIEAYKFANMNDWDHNQVRIKAI